MANLAAYILWLLDRADHIETIERCLLEKVIEPDFRFPMQDGRLSMARLCALRRERDQATQWFERARRVLADQGTRPLLAITDLNEAEMHLRLGTSPNEEPVASLLARANDVFKKLGMPGWSRYAESLETV
jgi:hypothetical protein